MVPRALSIAGSDSSGGAGIQADLKTFTVFRVYGMTAVTALTAQNTSGVEAVMVMPADFVAAQIRAVVDDLGPAPTKTGMLATAEIIDTVAAAVERYGLQPLVVDPVMVAQSGASLLEPEAVATLRSRLLPLATLVTPNVPEAETLLGRRIRSVADMREAARALVELGAGSCLLKGGHLEGERAIDVFDDGRQATLLEAPRIATPHTHGTGCQLSAAIVAGLAKGMVLGEAVQLAKQFIQRAIASALPLGRGRGPANALAWLAS
ncbi:MAG: bifunctional hydroxymethylpyrimidine kinase/phosphomethylpyrimidine kinase [Candidatus Binatia bacterium]|nr:bifunctional hydroxymethylpyrimidine kinase/phosphomethylpyrimidine kinase [Candidatus Binatia bacterium]